jgi:putative transposase
MKANQKRYSVERMCKVFKVSRSAYYAWRKGSSSARKEENLRLTAQIEQIHAESRKRYGSPKITARLQELGWQVSRPRVARLMRQAGIRSIITKRYKKATTNSKHAYPLADNLLARDFHAVRPAEKWVSDITYIPCQTGWLYLTIIMDLYDRKIVGWAISSSLETSVTSLAAFKMAVRNRPLSQALIFHSDRGVQYAAHNFRRALQKYPPIRQSMSRKANCWDNAVAENFFKILKSELVDHSRFYSSLQAKNALFDFIEIWYNRKRKHTYLGYKSPVEFMEANPAKCA